MQHIFSRYSSPPALVSTAAMVAVRRLSVVRLCWARSNHFSPKLSNGSRFRLADPSAWVWHHPVCRQPHDQDERSAYPTAAASPAAQSTSGRLAGGSDGGVRPASRFTVGRAWHTGRLGSAQSASSMLGGWRLGSRSWLPAPQWPRFGECTPHGLYRGCAPEPMQDCRYM